MMARFRFELATPEDDAGLRGVLRETTMPGTIELQLLREPSFFAANDVLGGFHQTIICRDTNSGEIVGCGCRSVRDLNVDGRVQSVGYLSMLRGKKQFRSRGLMARGYRFLRELHDDGRAEFYLTTIAEGNDEAITLLTSGRTGLPRYTFEGTYSTFVIPCRRPILKEQFAPAPDLTFRAASKSDVDAIVSFLAAEASSRSYFPNYQPSDFFGPDNAFRNLNVDNVLLAIDGAGDVVGTMALWDQRAFRQTVVKGYQGPLRSLRPVYNVWAQIAGGIRLPKPGQKLNYAYVAIPVAPERFIFKQLLAQIIESAKSIGLEYVLLGCHESDEHWSLIKSVSARSYRTRVYRVRWPDGSSSEALAGAKQVPIPYFELGCL